MSVLQQRLKNCLQTIFDLQPAMRKICLNLVAPEMARLKTYASRVDGMELAEEDVARIEKLAGEFLREASLRGAPRPRGQLQ